MAIEETVHGWRFAGSRVSANRRNSCRPPGHVVLGVRCSTTCRGGSAIPVASLDRVNYCWETQLHLTDPGADGGTSLTERWDQSITPSTTMTLVESVWVQHASLYKENPWQRIGTTETMFTKLLTPVPPFSRL